MTSLITLTLVFFSLTLFASSPSTQWITPDFYVSVGESLTERTFEPTNENCRAHISKVMCFVDPASPEEIGKDRPCLEGGLAYAKYFEALYDAYPRPLQKMFCSLNRIFVEKKFFGTAFAGVKYTPEGKINGAAIGIRQSVLDESLNLHTWASWKEQLSFGGIAGSYTLTPHLPTIFTKSKTKANDFLYFVVAHEFGHLFDFANHLNGFKDPQCLKTQDAECEVSEDSWAALSWLTNKTPRPENEFAHRHGLCFYRCEKTLPRAAIFPLYHGLYVTSFISTYAATGLWDDFADSLAYYLMADKLQTSYVIDTRNTKRYDIRKKLYTRQFASKFRYLREFLNRDVIAYP